MIGFRFIQIFSFGTNVHVVNLKVKIMSTYTLKADVFVRIFMPPFIRLYSLGDNWLL